MDGSSALLLNIISLTVMAVSMAAALKYAQTSNQSVKALSNGGQNLFKKFGGEKLTEGTRKGMGGLAKNKALDTEARMARSDGPIRNRIGGFRSRRKFRKDTQASERQRAQEDSLANFYGGTTQRDIDRREAAAGIGAATGGADRVGAQADAVQRKRQIEELERRQLPEKEIQQAIAAAATNMKLHPEYAQNGNGVAERALQIAIASNDSAAVRASMAHLSQSIDGVSRAHRVIQETETNGDMTATRRAALAAGVNDNWTNFKTKDAATSGWATDPQTRSMGQVEAAAGTYSGLKVEQLATQSEYAAHAAATNGAVSQATAQAVLDSPAQTELTSATRAIYQAIANGQAPPQPAPNLPAPAPPTIPYTP